MKHETDRSQFWLLQDPAWPLPLPSPPPSPRRKPQPGPEQAADQSLGNRAHRDPGHVHGIAGYVDRQRVAALHRRRPGAVLRRGHLDSHHLPGGQCGRAAHVGVAVAGHRAQELLPAVRRAVHGNVVPVRHRSEPRRSCSWRGCCKASAEADWRPWSRPSSSTHSRPTSVPRLSRSTRLPSSPLPRSGRSSAAGSPTTTTGAGSF